METDPNEKRFARLEKKINFLTALMTGQVPSTLKMILILIAVASSCYFFRAQIPSWFGRLSRFAFAQMFAAQKSDSVKDIE